MEGSIRDTFPLNTFVSVGTDEPFSGLVVGYDRDGSGEEALVVSRLHLVHPADACVVPSKGAKVPLYTVHVTEEETRWVATASVPYGSRSRFVSGYGSSEQLAREAMFVELAKLASESPGLAKIVFGED